MIVKEVARNVIHNMPDNNKATMEDIIDALYMRAKFERGEQEIREGLGVPHEQATERLKGGYVTSSQYRQRIVDDFP